MKFSLSQWLNFKLSGITCLVGKIIRLNFYLRVHWHMDGCFRFLFGTSLSDCINGLRRINSKYSRWRGSGRNDKASPSWSYKVLRWSQYDFKLVKTICFATVDGRNPANHLRLVVYPIIYRVLYIPGGAGFLPSNSIIPLCKDWLDIVSWFWWG